jgi:hypothetical protein
LDVGQVLHTLDCINIHHKDKSASDHTHMAYRASDGPGGWGGVAASIVRTHATDATLLCSTLLLAEGLLEYVQAEGLDHTGGLVEAAITSLGKHIKGMQVAASSNVGRAVPNACAKSEVAKDSKVQRAPSDTVQQQQQQQQQQGLVLSWGACAQAVLFGFQDLEGEYAVWVCQLCSRLMVLWRSSYLVWLLVWTAQRLRGGESDLASDLHVPLLCSLPNIVGMALSLKRRYRWVSRQARVLAKELCHQVVPRVAAPHLPPPFCLGCLVLSCFSSCLLAWCAGPRSWWFCGKLA